MLYFINNWIVQSVALTWIFSQFVLKPIISSIQKRTFDLKAMLHQGGMPSAHSTLVSALSTSVGIQEGFTSTIFLVTLAFSILVVYEALVTRNFIGQLSKFINQNFKDTKLRENIGHTLMEIFIGLIIGIVGVLLFFGYLV